MKGSTLWCRLPGVRTLNTPHTGEWIVCRCAPRSSAPITWHWGETLAGLRPQTLTDDPFTNSNIEQSDSKGNEICRMHISFLLFWWYDAVFDDADAVVPILPLALCSLVSPHCPLSTSPGIQCYWPSPQLCWWRVVSDWGVSSSGQWSSPFSSRKTQNQVVDSAVVYWSLHLLFVRQVIVVTNELHQGVNRVLAGTYWGTQLTVSITGFVHRWIQISWYKTFWLSLFH